MKKLIIKSFLFACIFTNTISAQLNVRGSLYLEGTYNGKNLFIKNSYGPGGMGYCVNQTLVNGKPTKNKINGDMFMVDLTSLGLKTGENVKIEILYSKDCTPRLKPLILNPGAITTNNEANKENASFTIEGIYSFQNIFISNPAGPNGKGFGLKEIIINGKPLTTNFNLPTFEIDLFALNLKNEESVKIEFKYLKGYDPTILNPEALK